MQAAVPAKVGAPASAASVRRSQGNRACAMPSSARDVKVARHGGCDPGNLLALGALLNACPHRFKGHFNLPPGDGQFPSQLHGERRIAPRAIARRSARTRRIGEQRALRRLHDSEAPAERPRPTPPQGIIPTGIEEQELHIHPAVLHPGEDPIGGDGMVFDIAGRTEARANRDEVVHVLDLHAMAREEEETRTAAWYPVRKAVDGLFHGGLIGIPWRVTSNPRRRRRGARLVASWTGLLRGLSG
jgi:hypothetical protein